MKFRTSWFNPTLAAHHWKRGWPLPVIMLIWCLCMYVISFANQISYWRCLPEIDVQASFCAELNDMASTLPVLLVFGAMAAALIVFRHLHSRSASQFYLTMPMKRRCSWLTSAVSGWMMAAVPMVITIVMLLILSATNALPAAPVLRLLLFGLSCWTIFYALAVLSCILGGNCFGSLLIYAGINCALYILNTCAACIASWVITGYAGTPLLDLLVLWLTPAAKLETCISDNAAALGMTVPLIYLFAGAVLLALSGVLYQHRKTENAGETVAFVPIGALCKVVGALLVCVLGAILIESCIYLEAGFSFAAIIALVLCCLVIGWFAAAMIIRRSFRVFDKRECTGLVITAAVILLLLTAGKLDVFGYASRVPDLTEVTAAELECDGINVEMEPEELLDIHETILAHPEETVPSSSSGIAYTVDLLYTLDNGAQLKRSYNLAASYRQAGGDGEERYMVFSESTIYNKISDILSEPRNNLQTWFPGWPDEPDPSRFVFAGVSIYESADSDGTYVALSAEQAQTIYQAFLEDIEAGNVQPAIMSGYDDYCMITIQLAYGNAAYTKSLIPANDGAVYYTDEYCTDIYVQASMINTLAALESCGISTEAAVSAGASAAAG